MSTEPERPEDELRFVVGALREHLVWQDACGAHGLPRAHKAVQGTEPEASEAAEDSQPSWQARSSQPQTVSQSQQTSQPRPPVVRLAPKPAEDRTKRLEVVGQEAKSCERCPLHKGRRNVVYGTGPVDADIMIVGEGPGAEEDVQGIPFVGKAGQLLDRMLGAMGYDRTQVYIGNVVKCRPPENRTPVPEEMEACMPYLREQIELVRPKVILAMGTTAVRGLLGIGGITRIRGRWKLYQAEIPVMPTFHPAYLLRNEAAKRDVWNDLKAVLKHLNREVPKRTR